MGIIKGLFGGGDSGGPSAPPAPPPVAPPAYTTPTPADAAGNVSQGARAAGAFSNTIVTGPEGLKKPAETTSNKLQLGA